MNYKNVIIYVRINFYNKVPYRESGINLNKNKEKKLNLIKSEIKEIKNFILSDKNLDVSEHNELKFNDDDLDDTLTLTKIHKKENKMNNNSNLIEIKENLEKLKSSIDDNKALLEDILAKIK